MYENFYFNELELNHHNLWIAISKLVSETLDQLYIQYNSEALIFKPESTEMHNFYVCEITYILVSRIITTNVYSISNSIPNIIALFHKQLVYQIGILFNEYC